MAILRGVTSSVTFCLLMMLLCFHLVDSIPVAVLTSPKNPDIQFLSNYRNLIASYLEKLYGSNLDLEVNFLSIDSLKQATTVDLFASTPSDDYFVIDWTYDPQISSLIKHRLSELDEEPIYMICYPFNRSTTVLFENDLAMAQHLEEEIMFLGLLVNHFGIESGISVFDTSQETEFFRSIQPRHKSVGVEYSISDAMEEEEFKELQSVILQQMTNEILVCSNQELFINILKNIHQDFFPGYVWFACAFSVEEIFSDIITENGLFLESLTEDEKFIEHLVGMLMITRRFPSKSNFVIDAKLRPLTEALITIQEYFYKYEGNAQSSPTLSVDLEDTAFLNVNLQRSHSSVETSPSEGAPWSGGFQSNFFELIKDEPALLFDRFQFSFSTSETEEEGTLQKRHSFGLFNFGENQELEEVLLFYDSDIDGSSQRDIVWPGGCTQQPSRDAFDIPVVYLANRATPKFQLGFKTFVDLQDEGSLELGLKIRNHFDVVYKEYDSLDSDDDVAQLLAEIGSELTPVIFVGDLTDAESITFTRYLLKAEIFAPVISVRSASNVVNSPEEFPNLLRSSQEGCLQGLILNLFIQFLGWESVCLAYESSQYGSDLYDRFQDASAASKISIRNAEDHREVGVVGTSIEDEEQAIEIISRMRERRCSIFVYLGVTEFVFQMLEIQHDLRMYGNGFLQVGTEWLGNAPVKLREESEASSSKLEKMLEGSLGILPPIHEGSLGSSVNQQIEERYGMPATASFYSFDAGLLIGHGVSSLNEQGLPLSDSDSFTNALRQNSFVSSTGTFKFFPDLNMRESFGFDIYNLAPGADLVQIGHYDLMDFKLYDSSEIYWPGNASSAPSAVNESKCPFYEFEREVDPMYRHELLLVSAIAVVLTIVLSVYLLRDGPRKYPLLDTPAKIEPLDAGIAFMLLAELLVLISFSPSFTSRQRSFKETLSITDKINEIGYENSFVSTASLALAFSLYRLWKVASRMIWESEGNKDNGASEGVFMFLVGNVFFLYTLKVLSSINDCSVVVEFREDTETYLYQECTIECTWDGGGSWPSLMVFGNFVLFVFLLSGVQYRINFQGEELSTLNINQSRDFLALKCVMYTILVFGEKLLRELPKIHMAVSVSVVLILLAYIISFSKEINTKGPHLLQVGTYLCLLGENLLTIIFEYLRSEDGENYWIHWICLTTSFWFLTLVGTFVMMGSGFKLLFMTNAEEGNTSHMVRSFWKKKTLDSADIDPKLRRRGDFVRARERWKSSGGGSTDAGSETDRIPLARRRTSIMMDPDFDDASIRENSSASVSLNSSSSRNESGFIMERSREASRSFVEQALSANSRDEVEEFSFCQDASKEEHKAREQSFECSDGVMTADQSPELAEDNNDGDSMNDNERPRVVPIKSKYPWMQKLLLRKLSKTTMQASTAHHDGGASSGSSEVEVQRGRSLVHRLPKLPKLEHALPRIDDDGEDKDH